MKRRTPLIALLAATLVACDPSRSTSPDAESLAPLGSVPTTSEDASRRRGERVSLLDRLADEIRGFGGLYRAAPCRIVVVLTDASNAELAIRVVHAALAPALGARRCPEGFEVGVQPGTFTYHELQKFLAASRPLLRIRGVEGVKVSYELNALVVSLSARPAAAAVLEALPGLGIPQEAVTFQPS